MLCRINAMDAQIAHITPGTRIEMSNVVEAVTRSTHLDQDEVRKVLATLSGEIINRLPFVMGKGA